MKDRMTLNSELELVKSVVHEDHMKGPNGWKCGTRYPGVSRVEKEMPTAYRDLLIEITMEGREVCGKKGL